MNTKHKLYSDGRFFYLATDPVEKEPMAREDLSGSAAAGATILQAALDQYANARPAHLSR